jgi:hypothetical protein|tara:strand:- start:600 stop:911 length:312 start_codon:yes stop_codon:yes gene_type:complete
MDFIDNYNKPIYSMKYIFSEEAKMHDTLQYIRSTYRQHYAHGTKQATEFIAEAGHLEGFCLGNIIKYAQRYGKKEGESKKENLMKIVHYALIAMEDKNEKEKF